MAAIVDFDEVVAAFPPLLATAAAFFLLASDCEKRKNMSWELGRERETDSKKREKKSNKEMRGERKVE